MPQPGGYYALVLQSQKSRKKISENTPKSAFDQGLGYFLAQTIPWNLAETLFYQGFGVLRDPKSIKNFVCCYPMIISSVYTM
jgi:hypothetical protein